MRVILVALLFLLAGCAAPNESSSIDAGVDDPNDASGSTTDPANGAGAAATSSGPGKPIENQQKSSGANGRLLVDLDDETLRSRAAEAVIPAGQYGVFRFIMTGAMYDGNAASGSYEWTMSAEGPDEGVVMIADARVSPFAEESDPVTPSTTFYDTGNTWMARSGSYSCSGCEHPARSQIAWLVGSPDGDVTFRFGIATADVNDLLEREAVPIHSDAIATNAWAGTSLYSWSLGSEYDAQSGVLQVAHAGIGPAQARGQRTSTFSMDEIATERGVFAMQLYANDPAGLDQYQFGVSAASYDETVAGNYVHSSPYGSLQTASGQLDRPIITLQSIIDPGQVSFAGERTYTGPEDLVAVPLFGTFERATIGWAGVDLAELYGWEMAFTQPSGTTAYSDVFDSFGPHHDAPMAE